MGGGVEEGQKGWNFITFEGREKEPPHYRGCGPEGWRGAFLPLLVLSLICEMGPVSEQNGFVHVSSTEPGTQ